MQEQDKQISPKGCSESGGTGAISSIVFMIAVVVLMIVVSHYIG